MCEGISCDLVVTMPGSQVWDCRFVFAAPHLAVLPGCYINGRHCGGLYVVLLQLKDPLEIFVKRREILPSARFLCLVAIWPKLLKSTVKSWGGLSGSERGRNRVTYFAEEGLFYSWLQPRIFAIKLVFTSIRGSLYLNLEIKEQPIRSFNSHNKKLCSLHRIHQ